MNIMDKPIITETHVRKAHMLIRHPELERVIRAAALEKCGIPDSDAVTVTEDQMKLPRVGPLP